LEALPVGVLLVFPEELSEEALELLVEALELLVEALELLV
jgi:hypothetical protein